MTDFMNLSSEQNWGQCLMILKMKWLDITLSSMLKVTPIGLLSLGALCWLLASRLRFFICKKFKCKDNHYVLSP